MSEGKFKYLSAYFSVLGFQQFLDQESECTLDLVEEGKEHIKREKRRIQRVQESANRRREFTSRFRDSPDEERGEKSM